MILYSVYPYIVKIDKTLSKRTQELRDKFENLVSVQEELITLYHSHFVQLAKSLYL